MVGEKEWLGENNIVDTAFQTESEEDANEAEKLRHEIKAIGLRHSKKNKRQKNGRRICNGHCLNTYRHQFRIAD